MNYRVVIKPRTPNPKPKPAIQIYDYARELKELNRLVRKLAPKAYHKDATAPTNSR